jgi:hypothetical protein
LTRERRPAWTMVQEAECGPSAGGRFPPPRPPPCRIGRLSCPLTPAGVPVMFRRSSGSSPISKRSVEPTALLRAMYIPRGTHVRSLARRKPGVQIPSPPPPYSQVRASPAQASDAHCMLRPRRGRKLRSLQPGDTQRRGDSALRPHKMTTQRGRRQAADRWAILAHPAAHGRPRGRSGRCPTTAHNDDQV